jgi:hypothetical protein
MQAVAALLAALNVITGAPTNVGTSPDRPPIVAPIPAASSAAGTEIKGTVASMQTGKIVVNGVTITLAKNTQINGTLRPGATVEVKVTKQADGSFVASQVQVASANNSNKSSDDSVNKKDDKNKSNDDKNKSSDDKNKSNDDKNKSSDDKNDDKSGDHKSGDDKSSNDKSKSSDDKHKKPGDHDSNDDDDD